MSRGASAFDVGLRRVRAGEVTTAMLGTDCARGRWLAGIALSHSWGEGSYRGSSEGTVSSTVTGLYPYARYAVSEGSSPPARLARRPGRRLFRVMDDQGFIR